MEELLHPAEAEVANSFFKVLKGEVQAMTEIWGEKPYLYRGGITIREKCKTILPVSEIYFVLGGLYRHGNFYKVVPVEDEPGKYEFQHKLISYRLNPSTYRKTVEKRLVGVLRSIIAERAEILPPELTKMAIQEGTSSIDVVCRFSGHKWPTLAISVIPVLEGTGLPAEVNPMLESVCHDRDVTINGPDGIGHPVWFLGLPDNKTRQTWNLCFPVITEAVLRSSKSLMHSVLFVTWIAESRHWNTMGLESPAEAITAIALHLAMASPTFVGGSFHEQVIHLLQKLLDHVRANSILDFYVLNRNYLKLDAEGSEKQETFAADVEKTRKLFIVMPDAMANNVPHKYMLKIPQVSPSGEALHAGEMGDPQEEKATDGSQHTSSDEESLSDSYQQLATKDEGGAGEGILGNDLPPPPLDVVEVVSAADKQNGVALMAPSAPASQVTTSTSNEQQPTRKKIILRSAEPEIALSANQAYMIAIAVLVVGVVMAMFLFPSLNVMNLLCYGDTESLLEPDQTTVDQNATDFPQMADFPEMVEIPDATAAEEPPLIVPDKPIENPAAE